jgi:nucleoid-associated protein YgaU
VVVVAVAAVGLYFAFVTPSATPATSGASSTSADAIASLDAPASAPTGTVEPTTPPAEAFAAPSSPLTDGPEALTLGPAPATAPSSGAAGNATSAAPATPATTSAVIPTGAGAASSVQATPALTPRTTVVEPAPAAGGARTYVIRQGDTLEAIARAQLGDGQKWRQIAAANPGVNPSNLKIGQSISIPEGGVEAPRATGNVGAATPVEGNSYTVQKGDTLVALSRKFYGGDGDWKRILEANRSLLKGDPASLKPGMKLTIPAKR